MSKKTTLMSVGCAVMSLLYNVQSHGVECNLAMVQDAQRQISCVHDSIFDEGYREKCDIVNKSPRAYFKILGYHSSFDGKEITPGNAGTGTLSKDDANNVGGLFGIEKQFNENWSFGTFTSFQYADCDFKYNSAEGPAIKHECSTRSAISGLYGRYCKDKWNGALVGSLGYLTFRNDSLQLINRNKYRGWSCALSGQISYNLSSQDDIEFGPMVGFDGSYIEEDGHVEFLTQPDNTIGIVRGHNVKSLTTFVGAYGKRTFFIKEHKTLAYANAGWSCECLRNGNKYSYEHQGLQPEYYKAYLPYLPRNTAKVRVGIKSFFNERIEGELAVGASFGSDYYNINGNVAINYQF